MEQKYRTIWISDVHLGTKGCQSAKLLDFLRHTESDTLILVGDIIDLWALKRTPHWPEEHNRVVQKILKKARHGTQVIYIPGNHDEALREYVGMFFGEIEVKREHTHMLADGRRLWCVHGDDYDIIMRYSKWLAVLGDLSYTFLMWLNRHFNRARSLFGMKYWSLSAYIKHQVKQAVNFIGDFERNLATEAAERGVDGVLCGHIHHAEITIHDNILYVNSGDWVESCTAIVEDYDGTIKIIDWKQGANRNGRVGPSGKRSRSND